MDILILHHGEQLGPLSDTAVRRLLADGAVDLTDPAWRTGMQEWAPLAQVLSPASAEAGGADVAPEPATERQKAFLAYMGIAFSPTVTRVEAAQLVNDTMEHPKDPARFARWNEERLRLHPELYAAEIQARKEGRAQRFLEICQQAGAGLFEKVTKAHCQVLVGHLDVHAPNWDANENEATWKHFFPALGEKFPQLVTEEGRHKLEAGGKAGSPARPGPASLNTGKTRPASTPARRRLRAVVHGVIIGLATLGALWLGRGVIVGKPAPVPTPDTNSTVAAAPAPPAAPVSPPVAAATPPPVVTPPPAAPVEAPAPAMTVAAASPAPTTPEPPPKMDAPAAAPAGDLLAAPPIRATATLTKPIEVALTYGKVIVPAGKPVDIVRRNGPLLSVRYLDKVIDIPASSTDVDAEIAPTTPAAPPAQ